ncbi:hypothetical protein [Nocardioides sp.]|uniref:hypothetical protein n=1 Tax=Nocardioides sp. TaxID=35761 RepID=UPI003517E50E
MKVIGALATADPFLLSPDFSSSLRNIGASSAQVNLDDAHVADAMRFGPDPAAPVRAVVSVHLTDDVSPGALVDLMRGVDPEARAWVTDEVVPLEPPAVDVGERAAALANVALLRRPAAMAHEEWLADWLGRHTAVAIATQATFGYVQNPVLECLTATGDDVAGIVEELFAPDAARDPHVFYGSGGDRSELERRMGELLESCARFGAAEGLDLVPTSRYLLDLS